MQKLAHIYQFSGIIQYQSFSNKYIWLTERTLTGATTRVDREVIVMTESSAKDTVSVF